MIKVCLGILVCLSAFSWAEKAVKTFEYPKDTCSYDVYTIDLNTNVQLTFNGDFGSRGCRKFTLKAPDNPFYFYQICWHKLYYESPKCQSSLSLNYGSRLQGADFTGKNCQSSFGRSDLDGCLQADTSDELGVMNYFFWTILINDDRTSYWYNNEWHTPQPLNRVNDTFKIEVYASVTYNYYLIGGIGGGVVGLFVIIVVVIVIVRCLRRRKRATGMYCCSTYPRLNNTGDLKLSDGLSNECSCFGFTFWACIICRRRETSEKYHQLIAGTGEKADSSLDSKNKLENVSGLQDPDPLPPLTGSNNDANSGTTVTANNV